MYRPPWYRANRRIQPSKIYGIYSHRPVTFKGVTPLKTNQDVVKWSYYNLGMFQLSDTGNRELMGQSGDEGFQVKRD